MKFIVSICSVFIFLSCQEKENKVNYLLNKIDSEVSGVDFTNQIEEDINRSIITYIYYYNGGGVAAGDVNNDGLVDLYFVANMGENKLYLNKGNFGFQDATENAGVKGTSDWSTGVTMIDINNDGLLDIYVCAVSGLLNFKGRNELFVNNGDGTFTEKAREYGLDYEGYATQAYFFDYDKDDDLDVYIVNHAIHTTLSHGPANVRAKRVPFVGDVLLNNDNGKFSDVSEQSNIFGGVNGYGLSASIGDFNNDGWDDIYVCNDFHEDDYYYLNNQDGTFTEQLGKSFSTISRFSMGSDAADINNDGFLDLITLDMLPNDERVIKENEGEDAMFQMNKQLNKLGYKDQFARNMLQVNHQGKYFTETALFNGVESTDWSWGPLIADFNNDGYQDLFIANGILRRPNNMDFKRFVSSAFKGRSPDDGLKWLFKSKDSMPSGAVPNEIFMGDAVKFQNKSGKWIEDTPTTSTGAIYVDLDNDGDLDLVVNNLNEKASLYKNTTDTINNYISLELNYKSKNRSGIGAKVYVYSSKKKQFKQLNTSRGFLSSVDTKLHFGINKNEKVDSLHIIWPDNSFQKIANLELNKQHRITYSNNLVKYTYISENEAQLFKNEEKILPFAHIEDLYDDFLYEKLLPYKVSTIGPAVAIGDIDKNGYEDVFIGGASGEKSSLYLNDGLNFTKMKIPAVENDSLYEDNSAIFFDADNDNDLDLYVASGIHKVGIASLQNDRLYINTNGNFEKSLSGIPDNLSNSAVVTAADYDNDGDQDLFVGNLSIRGNYGAKVPSYILINDGSGKFTVDNKFRINSHVTSAVWKDINKDGFHDLLIATEWDTPKVYLNNRGVLNLINLPENLSGLWQSISVFDVDEDGDDDIVLGNWGLNTRLKASVEKPLHLYHSDFNDDGKYETILAYNIDGKYYPIHSKDELQGQLNFIRKKYPSYKKYALQTVQDILGSEILDKSTLYELKTLASGYLLNENNTFTKFIPFADALQLGPINSFSEVRLPFGSQLMIAGNSERVNNYNGGYLSLKGFLMKNKSEFKNLSDLGIEPFDNEIRNVRIVKQKNRNLILVFPNNDSLKVYSF
jgi:hypothetical protein